MATDVFGEGKKAIAPVMMRHTHIKAIPAMYSVARPNRVITVSVNRETSVSSRDTVYYFGSNKLTSPAEDTSDDVLTVCDQVQVE